MLAPSQQDQIRVDVFEEAFTDTTCPTCAVVLSWQPPDGVPRKDAISEKHPEEDVGFVRIWTASCCGVTYELQWAMQRPSDHSTPYGYVKRVQEG